jgi:hypothetical protein
MRVSEKIYFRQVLFGICLPLTGVFRSETVQTGELRETNPRNAVLSI